MIKGSFRETTVISLLLKVIMSLIVKPGLIKAIRPEHNNLVIALIDVILCPIILLGIRLLIHEAFLLESRIELVLIIVHFVVVLFVELAFALFRRRF